MHFTLLSLHEPHPSDLFCRHEPISSEFSVTLGQISSYISNAHVKVGGFNHSSMYIYVSEEMGRGPVLNTGILLSTTTRQANVVKTKLLLDLYHSHKDSPRHPP